MGGPRLRSCENSLGGISILSPGKSKGFSPPEAEGGYGVGSIPRMGGRRGRLGWVQPINRGSQQDRMESGGHWDSWWYQGSAGGSNHSNRECRKLRTETGETNIVKNEKEKIFFEKASERTLRTSETMIQQGLISRIPRIPTLKITRTHPLWCSRGSV